MTRLSTGGPNVPQDNIEEGKKEHGVRIMMSPFLIYALVIRILTHIVHGGLPRA